MHYPFWYVPALTSPMWIAIVATLHMYVAMYAVGGSILIAIQTALAYRRNDDEALEYMRNHTWFFLLLTVVFGALSGIGIWWTIGLASPLATEDLIHIFVLGWAAEYVTFLVEIASIFVFFYYWGRMDRKTHMRMGWIYAWSAWISLVIITGITAFQLNSGGWKPGMSFWSAFFNPQTFPQIISRTGGSLLLGALYFFLHSSLWNSANERLKDLVSRDSSRCALVGAVLTIIGGIWWFLALPPSGAATVMGAAVLNVFMGLIIFLTAGIVGMMYLGPFKNPKWLTPGFAILFFALGLAAVGVGEFIREAVRKPYIVWEQALGNQVRPNDIPNLRENGYLAGGVWTSAYIKHKFPDAVKIEAKSGKSEIDYDRLLSLSPRDRIQAGRAVFQYHCNDCHAVEGYSAMAQLTRGWDQDMIFELVTNLNKFHFFMPPWSGNEAEARLLTDYLDSIKHPHPRNVLEGAQKEEK